MENYKFNISLSVLNHLGRNLYRSLITVIGEAISNSWDADAKNVHIYIDREKNQLVVQDDGVGMTPDDFQNKFLKIGYSKRKDGTNWSPSKRPFIGRKGIGKLALLSCAKSISIITKTQTSSLTGGTIDNASLDQAIKDDIMPNDYNLTPLNSDLLKENKKLSHGTIIIFNGMNDGIKNRIDYLRQLIALDFRFSLFDPSFNISVNGKEISMADLEPLINDTQFLWLINHNDDNDAFENAIRKSNSLITHHSIYTKNLTVSGFIASVDTPSKLKIRASDEKATVDLFVNGRLREKNILSHIPSTRITESYLYGQIHFNELDDDTDRFTSSREGVVPDDPKFNSLLDVLKKEIMAKIIEEWDDLRRANRKTGDSDNKKIPPRQRKSEELYDAITDDYAHFDKTTSTEDKDRVNSWINELKPDAVYNYESYGDCFLAENLLRKYITTQKIAYPDSLKNDIKNWKEGYQAKKDKANLSIQIRHDDNDLSYCGMEQLAYIADTEKDKQKKSTLLRDCIEYTPIRDAVAHTSRLTDVAKLRLNACFENIKARIKNLLKISSKP